MGNRVCRRSPQRGLGLREPGGRAAEDRGVWGELEDMISDPMADVPAGGDGDARKRDESRRTS